MFVVVFESDGGAPLSLEAPGGSRLIDLCDECSAAVPFSCRSASCGTCRVEILEGADCLEPAMDEELDVLDAFGDNPASKRLACQARLRGGPNGRVRVRVVPEDDSDR